MLSEQELEQKPDDIEGLEGLDPTWCVRLCRRHAPASHAGVAREIDFDDLEFGSELARGNFGAPPLTAAEKIILLTSFFFFL